MSAVVQSERVPSQVSDEVSSDLALVSIRVFAGGAVSIGLRDPSEAIPESRAIFRLINFLDQAIEPGGPVVLNLSGVQYLNDDLTRAIAGLIQDRAMNGNLVLVGLEPKAREKVLMMRLGEFFKEAASEAQGVALLNSDPQTINVIQTKALKDHLKVVLTDELTTFFASSNRPFFVPDEYPTELPIVSRPDERDMGRLVVEPKKIEDSSRTSERFGNEILIAAKLCGGELVVDLGKVGHIGEVAIGYLMRAATSLLEEGGVLSLVNVAEPVAKKLRNSRLEQILNIESAPA